MRPCVKPPARYCEHSPSPIGDGSNFVGAPNALTVLPRVDHAAASHSRRASGSSWSLDFAEGAAGEQQARPLEGRPQHFASVAQG
jgi:hypothetical protein